LAKAAKEQAKKKQEEAAAAPSDSEQAEDFDDSTPINVSQTSSPVSLTQKSSIKLRKTKMPKDDGNAMIKKDISVETEETGAAVETAPTEQDHDNGNAE